MSSSYHLLAIGNALVDILAQVEDSFISRHDMHKGAMQLVDEKRASELYVKLKNKQERSGGSAANTAASVASFGGKAAFIGKVKQDKLGATFSKDMAEIQVDFTTTPNKEGVGTGHCMIAITPDSQRTMNTCLGIAPFISETDIDENLIRQAKVTYLEGYLWDQPQTKEALKKAMDLAGRHGNEVAFTLSDAFCVSRHRAEFLSLLEHYVDIVFSNESEATSLFEVNSIEEVIPHFRRLVKIAIVTRSEEGSMIITPDQVITLPAEKNLKVVDTTGAGDLYAGGFLYGYAEGKSLEDCGKLGTLAAAEVIQQIGARPAKSLKGLLGKLAA